MALPNLTLADLTLPALNTKLVAIQNAALTDFRGTLPMTRIPGVQFFTPILTPAIVAANTTAEQTFTVSGLVLGSAVIVNKPTAQAGLGIDGARVSAPGVLAITFANVTAVGITPTAGEKYIVCALRSA